MIQMTKKTEDSEATVETTNKQEREITEEEENLNLDPNKTDLEKEEEDKIHLTIINIMTDLIEAEATLETEEALGVKVKIEETPEVGVETASAEAEATLLIIEALHQIEEKDNLKGEKDTVDMTAKEIILEITPEIAGMTGPHQIQEADHKEKRIVTDLLQGGQTKDQTPEGDQAGHTQEEEQTDRILEVQTQITNIMKTIRNVGHVDLNIENQHKSAQITVQKRDSPNLAKIVKKATTKHIIVKQIL